MQLHDMVLGIKRGSGESQCLQLSSRNILSETWLQRKFTVENEKKRRFTGNQYTKKSSSSTEAASVSKESIEKSNEVSGDEEHSARGVKSKSFKSLPASVQKLKPLSDDSSEESSDNEGEILQGFRLVDISVLATVFMVFLQTCSPFARRR